MSFISSAVEETKKNIPRQHWHEKTRSLEFLLLLMQLFSPDDAASLWDERLIYSDDSAVIRNIQCSSIKARGKQNKLMIYWSPILRERAWGDAILKDFLLSESHSDSGAAHSLCVSVTIHSSSRIRSFLLFSPHFLSACLIFSLLLIPVAQTIEIGASNAEVMGSTPREYKNWCKPDAMEVTLDKSICKMRKCNRFRF